ncbi:MAG TPA: NAD(P)H-dependent oxidoreductase [Candidatus Dormibacteraeota bacterium]|nr:NAD(P)H-dependent oxidoreductase [Candidatus Dormibacteraeota bacterium]
MTRSACSQLHTERGIDTRYWASRPPGSSVLMDKPIAIVGDSPGRGGTARVQAQLRETFVFIGSAVLRASSPGHASTRAGGIEHNRTSSPRGRQRCGDTTGELLRA